MRVHSRVERGLKCARKCESFVAAHEEDSGSRVSFARLHFHVVRDVGEIDRVIADLNERDSV